MPLQNVRKGLLGKKWGIEPHITQWVYTTVIRSKFSFGGIVLLNNAALNDLFVKESQAILKSLNGNITGSKLVHASREVLQTLETT